MAERDLFGQRPVVQPRPKDGDKPVHIQLEVHQEGVEAWTVSSPGSTRRFYLPARLCTRGAGDVFTMPLWIARDRRLM